MLPVVVESRLRRIIDAYDVHVRLPVPVEELAHKLGWEIEYCEHAAPVYGLITCDGGRRRIIVNANISLAWKRATIAHELGHWIAGHLREGDSKLSEMYAEDILEEREASAVAAALLIPRRTLEHPGATKSSIASACGVPRDLVRLRLRL